ncbi:MAG: Hsp33 family molecular chaperone HslO [Gammaproteobacteria bacterium]
MTIRDKDCLFRFVFEHTNVRGELVHLDAAWQAILERHEYPEPVRNLLGQMIAAAALLSATIKINGSLHLQLQGDGPVSMLLVQAGSDRALRGLAHWREGDIPNDFQSLVGDARLSLTIDPGEGGEQYQGIVAVEDDSLTASLESYFRQSEQLATHLWLAVDDSRASGMLLQQLPGESEDADAWSREVQLASTITDQELLALPVRDLLHRLYHEEDVRLFEAEPMSFRCSCSKQRIETVLRGLGYQEIQDILEEQGAVSVNCEFCNQNYSFDAVDVEELFAASNQPDIPSTRH